MNAKTAGWTFVVMISGVALGVAWSNARGRHACEAARVKVVANNARLTRAIDDGGGRLAASERERTALQATLSTMRKLAPSSPVAMAIPQFTGAIAERLQKDPHYQAYWLANKRAELAAKYGPLFRSLGLNAAQIGRFEENFVKREEQNIDYGAIASSQNRANGQISAELAGLMSKVGPEYQAAQRELLGDDGYRQLLDYERTSWVRDMVNGWAGGAVVVARDAFTPQQGEQLVQILAQASESYRKGGTVAAWEIDWGAVDSQARQILSEAQFKLFKTMEPPLPVGARFQSQLYRLVDIAQKKDASGAQRE